MYLLYVKELFAVVICSSPVVVRFGLQKLVREANSSFSRMSTLVLERKEGLT